MPIYEFKCTNTACNNVEEHLLRHSDPLPSNCEKCHSPIEKLVSQTSFSLKGSGWYVTDYKGSNPGAAANSSTNTPTTSTETSASTASTGSSAGSDSAGCGAPACGTSACSSN